jgi:Lon-like ATP-dependent protease
MRATRASAVRRVLKRTIPVASQLRYASFVAVPKVEQHIIPKYASDEILHKDISMVDLLEQLNGLKPLSAKDDKPSKTRDESDQPQSEERPESTEKPEKPEKPAKRERKKKAPEIVEETTEIASDTKAESSAANGTSSGGQGDDGDGVDDIDGKGPVAKLSVPEVYPQVLALPMSRRPLFPGFYRPVAITDPQVIKAIKELVEAKKPYIGIFLFKDENADGDVITHKDEVHEVGVFAQVTSEFTSKDEMTGTDTMTIIAYPHTRIRIDDLLPPKTQQEIDQEQADKTKDFETEVETELKNEGKDLTLTTTQQEKEERVLKRLDEENEYNPTEFVKKYEVTRVNISPLEDEPFDKKSPVINALTSEILKVFKDISQMNSMFREQIATFSATMQGSTNIFEQPSKLADFCAAVCAGEPQELQDVLDSLNIEERLEKALVVLKKEIMNAELQNKISKDVESKIQKRQREYYLMEQLKGIKKELGIDDGRQKLIDTFKKRAEELKLPPAVQKVFDEEISKMATLETAMSEFSVTRNYLDWLTQLPWGKYTKETFDIANAKKILDEDHYGLADIKDRILEFIAVGNLLGAVDGKIICFVGPPGVGKTSIGKSIARALNRNFFRFSVGGISDVSEIKGHRRTYIGALPGRIIQGLKKTQSQNPLFLIDEIDKVTHGGSQGDPSAALLELLDPEQNSEFLDQYMDIPVDLSKVLFVCTANTLDTIPRPLLDRMEIIELPGYVAEEKVKIAENYLIPLAKKGTGLENAKVALTTEGVEYIVKHYAKENGVRRLKQLTEKVFRKAAFKVVSQITEAETKNQKSKQAEQESKEVGSKDSKEEVNEEEIVPNLEHNKPLETKETVFEENNEAKKLSVPEDFQLTITPENLKDFIGPPIYTSDRLYETTPPGVVMGLAWTSIGGTSMYVEVTAEKAVDDAGKPQGGRLSITGQLGDVMKESSKISFSVAKQYVESDFFKTHNINLHCPEGATPKDGPSAGITLTTALISLAKNVPLPSIAMTGEITLTGKVLRIGGLKEKLIAAKRNGVTTLFLPKDNQGDYEVLAENLREGLDVTFVDNYSQIYDKLFK